MSNPEQRKAETLTEFCEPFFLEVGQLIRSSQYGGERDANSVRNRLKNRLDLLDEDASKASATLAGDYHRIEPVLAFFADDVIMTSSLPFSSQWAGPILLASHNRVKVVDGKQRFFLELDATLREPESQAAQRLAIFQTCLGLGFTGIHTKNPDKLSSYSAQILQKLDAHVYNHNAGTPICSTAYEVDKQEIFKPVVDDQELFRPVREEVLVIGASCVALVLASVVCYVAFYFNAIDQIQGLLKPIIGE